MFGSVIIPKAVYDELTINKNFEKEIESFKGCTFIRIEVVENIASVNILRNVTGLDAGESEAIVMVEEK